MQPRTDIMKLGSKPCAVAQFSKINCRDVSGCENIPDVFRGWLAEMKIIFSLYAVLVFGLFSFFFFFCFPEKKEKIDGVDFFKGKKQLFPRLK